MQINKWEKDKNTTIPSVDVVGIIVNVEHEERIRKIKIKMMTKINNIINNIVRVIFLFFLEMRYLFYQYIVKMAPISPILME